ncbi:MAG TPA: ribosome maturation factor RimM, partial [Caldimonas sp.]|nr:ribosome maturation factor RimM [Caldimonas sp.]
PSNDRPVAGVGALPTRLEIRAARPHGEAIVAAARGIDDRDGVDVLRGARIFLPRADFPAAGPDEFYWADLVGMTVINRDGESLGEVIGLLDNGAQSLLRVEPRAAAAAGPDTGAARATSTERLIPFVAAFIDEVDLAGRRIVVDWGLDY